MRLASGPLPNGRIILKAWITASFCKAFKRLWCCSIPLWRPCLNMRTSLWNLGAGADDGIEKNGNASALATVRALTESEVTDPKLRSEIATMIGEAYTKLNKLEHAADAFRGILR